MDPERRKALARLLAQPDATAVQPTALSPSKRYPSAVLYGMDPQQDQAMFDAYAAAEKDRWMMRMMGMDPDGLRAEIRKHDSRSRKGVELPNISNEQLNLMKNYLKYLERQQPGYALKPIQRA
jgi:hypothetical protein